MKNYFQSLNLNPIKPSALFDFFQNTTKQRVIVVGLVKNRPFIFRWKVFSHTFKNRLENC